MPDIFLPPNAPSADLALNSPTAGYVGEIVRDENGLLWSAQLVGGVLTWINIGSLDSILNAEVTVEELEAATGTIATKLKAIDEQLNAVVNKRIYPLVAKSTGVSGTASVVPDGRIYDFRLTGNVTITLETPTDPIVIRAYTTQDATGGRVVTWESDAPIIIDSTAVDTTGDSRTVWVMSYDGHDLGWFVQGLTPTSEGSPVIPDPPAETFAKKWNPGHYMQVLRGSYEAIQANRFTMYDQIASETAVEGVTVPFRWSQLEGATKGNYTAGIAFVQAEINKLKSLAVPKRMIIRMIDQRYGGEADSTFYPAYIISGGYVFQTSTGSNWRRDLDVPMNAYIDMLKAYATAFDDEPYFEGITLLRETAMAWGDNSEAPAGWSWSVYLQQLKKLAAAASTAFKKTNVVQFSNWLDSSSSLVSYVEYVRSIGGSGVGAPDIVPNTPLWIDRIIRGEPGYGGVDYRGTLPILCSIEVSELGGVLGNYTPTQLFDYANNQNRTSHLMWDRNTYSGTAEQQWATGILPFIRANPLTYTACPSVYSEFGDGCA